MEGSNNNNNEHTISVARALVQLKTKDSQIAKENAKGVYVTWKCNDEQNPKQRLTENQYQKVTDLIEHRKKLKDAVVQSNANTRVTIGRRTYTVAEAIERKNSMQHEKDLLTAMKTQLGNANRQVEVHNQGVRRQLDSLLEKMFSSNKNTSPEDIKKFSEEYMRAHQAELVDPLNLAEKIERLESDIVEFEAEVDIILSEKNGTTFIVVN